MKCMNHLVTIRTLVFVAIALSLNGSLKAQNTFVGDQVELLKFYDADHLLNIALPLGGIGTGTVSLGGRGELRDWEIMNVPGKGYSTVVKGNDAPFFAIYTRDEQGETKTKALLGPLYDSEYQDKEGRSVNNHGLPRFRNASFSSTYPFGLVKLWDAQMPVKVRLVGYNPLDASFRTSVTIRSSTCSFLNMFPGTAHPKRVRTRRSSMSLLYPVRMYDLGLLFSRLKKG